MALIRSSQVWAVLAGSVLAMVLVNFLVEDSPIPWWLVFAPLWGPGLIAFVIALIANMTGHGDAPRI